jgi:hypothetical protein
MDHWRFGDHGHGVIAALGRTCQLGAILVWQVVHHVSGPGGVAVVEAQRTGGQVCGSSGFTTAKAPRCLTWLGRQAGLVAAFGKGMGRFRNGGRSCPESCGPDYAGDPSRADS